MSFAHASAASCLALLFAICAGGAQAADVERGGSLAAKWCAQCHAATPAQPRVDAGPPAFSEIGRNPGLNAGTLGVLLMAPHPQMPRMSLARSEIEDLVAFIRAQAK